MKILLVVLSVAGMFVATSSIAGEGYIGVSAGIMNIEDDSAGTGFSDTPISLKVFGGYEFNENIALDVAYFGTVQDAEDDMFGIPVEISLDGFTVRAVGAYPTSDNFSILGSVGYWDGDAEASVLGISATAGEDGLTLGVGGKYRLESMSIRGEFEWFDSDDTIWMILVGVQINFGGN
jgi:OOP family OmpA-OmpF porin